MRLDWVIPGLLAGGSRPGLLKSIDHDLDLLSRFGFQLLVSLTQSPLEALPEDLGLETVHFPIPDMGAPTPREAHEICLRVLEHVDRGQAVLVHCRAGLGRTGTLLACCLVHRGLGAEEAIREVRLSNHRFIQSSVQERFVHHYAQFLEQEASVPKGG